MIVALSFLSECPLEFISVIRKTSGCIHKAPKFFSFIIIWFIIVIIFILSRYIISATAMGKKVALCKGSNFKFSGYCMM